LRVPALFTCARKQPKFDSLPLTLLRRR